MADFQITDKTLLTSVDRAADSLLIYDSSASGLKRTVVNNLVDLTSHSVGVDDVQTFTNKTLTTPTLTVNDNVFTVQDNADTTKKLQLQLSGITTGTTRTLTVPDVSDTVVTLTATQTLTNKTLTSPTINTATIANPTLTTDVVAEFTGANGVAVDGLNIKDGKLNTNDSVVTANITDAAVTPNKLLASTGTSWAWVTWSPTWTNLTVGNGVVTARYRQIGKTTQAVASITFGSTTSISGAVTISFPTTPSSFYSTVARPIYGYGTILDNGANALPLTVEIETSTTAGRISAHLASGTYASLSPITSTIPMTWTTGDAMTIFLEYENA